MYKFETLDVCGHKISKIFCHKPLFVVKNRSSERSSKYQVLFHD